MPASYSLFKPVFLSLSQAPTTELTRAGGKRGFFALVSLRNSDALKNNRGLQPLAATIFLRLHVGQSGSYRAEWHQDKYEKKKDWATHFSSSPFICFSATTGSGRRRIYSNTTYVQQRRLITVETRSCVATSKQTSRFTYARRKYSLLTSQTGGGKRKRRRKKKKKHGRENLVQHGVRSRLGEKEEEEEETPKNPL